MSNTKKPTAKPGQGKGLAAYRAEAKGGLPFRLPLDDEDGTVLVIPRPTANQVFEAEEAFSRGESKNSLRVLLGEKADEFFDAVGNEDLHVFATVISDVREFFGLGE